MDPGILAENRPDIRYVWRGPSGLVVDPQGRAGERQLTGYYFRQARFLHVLRLEVNGESPYPCSLAEIAPHELEFGYIYPELDNKSGGVTDSKDSDQISKLIHRDLDLRLRYRVHPASLEATLWITNRWQDQVEVDLAWVLGADYSTVDEAEFGPRQQEGPVEATSFPGGVSFRYGHTDLPFETRVVGYGATWAWSEGRLAARLSLPRQQPHELKLVARALDFEHSIDAHGEMQREERLERWRASVTLLRSPAETPLVEITNRAMVDLGAAALMEGPDDEWLAPGAGAPLYQTFWGRDALTASWQAAILDRGDMIENVLTHVGRLQGTRLNHDRDEEPGRIVNQAKTDPLSRLGTTAFARYYGDFASPFDFLIALGYRYSLTGSKDGLAKHWGAAKQVLEWARCYGDRDGDGYLEYLTSSKRGPRHQGWKDSENAVVYEDGRQVDPPIAPCEIQGYHYVSLQFMAVMSFVLGERKEALDLWRQAADLKTRFNRDFWMEDVGFIAFGLDADKQPIRALTSNAGQCLATGIVSEEHVPRLVRRLFEPDMFSGWGIRTLSTSNPAYHPLDYHLGAVWPVENATILFGLRRYGQNDRVVQLARALYDLARLWPGGRTPECVGGFARDEFSHPSCYPRANRPQTWNQTAFPMLVQSLLGIVPFAPFHLLMVDPLLPPWLPDLTLKRLRVGDASVTLRFHRSEKGESEFEVLEKEGELRIIRQPWIESLSVDWLDRARDLMDR